MKEKETTERELEDERDKKLRKANEEARLDLTILEESHVKDSKMVEDLREKKIEELKQGIASKYGATPLVKKLGEARKKRMNIELDLENMTPEFQEKYGDLIQKDLIAARKEEQETEEALKAIDRKVEKELPGELEKAMKMGLLESGKVDTIFDDEKNRINTRLRKTTHDIERSFEKKKNELYQKYLMNLGNLFEKGLSGVKNHIMVLPDENRNYAQVVHDLNALLRNVDRTRRKFAMDLKKRLDGKKVSSLENKLSSSKMKHESELSEIEKLRSDIEKQRKHLARAQREIRTLKDAEKDLVRKLEIELRERIEGEIRDMLVIEIKEEMDLEYKKREEQIIERFRSQAKTEDRPSGRTPYVRCPSCDTKIQILDSRRPLQVRCQGCGSEYTLQDKNHGSNQHRGQSNYNHPQHHDQMADDGRCVDFPGMQDITGNDNTRQNDSSVPINSHMPLHADTANTNGTKSVSCPHCGVVHSNVPAHFTKRLTCSCGRRIRTI